MENPVWSRRLLFGLSDHETYEHMRVGLNLNCMHVFLCILMSLMQQPRG